MSLTGDLASPDGNSSALIANTPSHPDHTFGVLLVGYLFAMIGAGFTFFQTYTYFIQRSKDVWLHKVCAAIVSVLDLATTALISRYVFNTLITLFFAPGDFSHFTMTFDVEFLLATLVVSIVQLFYCIQIWKHCGALFAALACGVAVFLGFGLSVGTVSFLFKDSNLVTLDSTPTKQLFLTALALTLASSAFTSVILYINAMHRERKYNMPSTPNGWYDWFVICFIDAGALASLFQLGYFIAFVSDSSGAVWLPFHCITTKFFVNSFLSYLTTGESGVDGSLSDDRSDGRTQSRIPNAASRISTASAFPTVNGNRISAIQFDDNKRANVKLGIQSIAEEDDETLVSLFVEV